MPSTASDAEGIGNVYDKYGTRNPIARWMMAGFLDAVSDLYRQAGARRVLEVGCGEGRLAHHLIGQSARPERFDVCDLSPARLDRQLDPALRFHASSIYALPFAERTFDLVLCCEVLEHLVDPARALRELARVTRHTAIISTPWEPVWRMLNLARARYVPAGGNTPGHIQHFTRRGLRRLVSTTFEITAERRPLPWTILACRPRVSP